MLPQHTNPGLAHQALPVEEPPDVSQQQTPFGVPTQTSEARGLCGGRYGQQVSIPGR